MKFCVNCGTKLADDAICPNCQASAESSNPEKAAKKKLNKMNVLIVIILIINILLSAVNTYFLVSNNSKGSVSVVSEKASDDSSSDDKDSCPASEYGNHDWEPANCQEPARCYECNAYKDDQLGSHKWVDEDGSGWRVCWNCGLPYESYAESQEG